MKDGQMGERYERAASVALKMNRFRLRKAPMRLPLLSLILLVAVGISAAEASDRSNTRGIGALPDSFVEFDGLRNLSDPVVVRGTADVDDTQGDRLVFAELMPRISEEAAPGETATIPRIGVAPVRDDGTYDLRLDLSSPIYGDAEAIRLTHVAGDEIVGAALLDLEDLLADGLANGPSGVRGSEKPSEKQGAIKVVDIERLVPEGAASGLPLTGGPESPAPSDSGVDLGLNGSPSEDPEATFDSESAGPVDYQSNCTLTVVDARIPVPTTVAVAGTGTNGAKLAVTFTHGARSELGWAIDVGNGWATGSGRRTVTNSSSVSRTWPWPGSYYHTWVYRADSKYRHERARCWYGPQVGWRTQDIIAPYGWTTGSHEPVTWGNQNLTYCDPQAIGQVTIDDSRATTWTGGAKLGWRTSAANVSAQSGYSTSVKIEFDFTKSGKYLCGRFGYPNETPGWLMADYEDN